MFISWSHGVAVFHPLNQAELEQWQPSPAEPLQFVALSDDEWQLFYLGKLLGFATRIRGSAMWQVSSPEGDVCIAPLHSPLDGAERLIERETFG